MPPEDQPVTYSECFSVTAFTVIKFLQYFLPVTKLDQQQLEKLLRDINLSFFPKRSASLQSTFIVCPKTLLENGFKKLSASTYFCTWHHFSLLLTR